MKTLVVLLLLLPFATAVDQEYVVNIAFEREGESILATITDIGIDTVTMSKMLPGEDFNVALLDGTTVLEQKDIQVELSVHHLGDYGGGEIPVDEGTGTVQLSYLARADRIRITSEWETKEFMIGDFICNNDGSCRDGENPVTCPTDCTEGSDGICDHRIDGFCDPDCPDRDVDCRLELVEPEPPVTPPVQPPVPPPTQPPKQPPTQPPVDPVDSETPTKDTYVKWMLIIGGLFVIIILISLLFRRKNEES